MVPSSLILGAVQDKITFAQEPSEKLMDFIYKVQQRDAFYATFNVEINWKHNRKEAARRLNWELDLMGLLYKNGKV